MVKFVKLLGTLGGVAALAIGLPSRAQTYNVPAGQTETITTVVSSGPVSVTGGGTVIFQLANTYGGGTSVLGGSTLQITTDGELGTAGTAVTLGDSVLSGTLNISGSAVATTIERPFVLNSGGGTIVGGTNAWTLDGLISGSGGLTIGGGTVIIPSALGNGLSNTYSGGTTIVGGATLEIAADVNTGGIGNTATLGASGAGITLGNATSSGTLDLINTGAVTSTRGLTIGAGGGTIEAGAAPAASWTFTGPVSGSGPLTVDGDGTLILDAISPYSGLATVTAGTFEIGDSKTPGASIAGAVTVAGGTLSGYGTIAGAVTNQSGTVMPGGGKTVGSMTVGSYTQGANGTLAITVTPSGVSELVVNGTADLAGTLKLQFEGAFRSSTLQLISAGAVDGTFSNEIGRLSATTDQQLVYTPTGVDLEITQLSTLQENPTLFTAVISEAIDEEQAANDVVLSHITDFLNGAALDGMRTADTPDHPAGHSSGNTPYGTWTSGLGGFGSTNGTVGAPGYSVSSGGFMTGIDTQVNSPGVFGGLAAGGSYSSINEHGGASAQLLTPRAMLYGGWWYGRLAISGTIGFGDALGESQRPIAGAGTTSSANFNGYEVTAALQASTNLRFGSFVITPAIGADYALLYLPALTETGGPYDISVANTATSSLRPFAAATATTRFSLGNMTLEPRLRFAVESEVLSNSRQVVVQPVGDAENFLIQGVDPSRNLVTGSAGVTIETSRDFGIYSDVGVIYSGNTNGASMDAGIRYRF